VRVDDPLVAVEDGAALQQGRVGARGRRLGHREAGADAALEGGLEPALLLFGAAVLGEDLHVAGVRGGAVEGHRGDHRAAAHLLAEEPVLPVLQPRAEALVGHEHVPEAVRLGLLADRHQVGRVGDAGADLGVERLHQLALGRVHLGVDEVEDALAQRGDLRGRFKVHLASSLR
jgi:hypothetical protein